MNFPIKDIFSKCDQKLPANLVTFTGEIFIEHFIFCAVTSFEPSVGTMVLSGLQITLINFIGNNFPHGIHFSVLCKSL